MNQNINLSLPTFKCSKRFLEDNFDLGNKEDDKGNFPTRKTSCRLGHFAPKQKFLQSFITPTPLSLNSNEKKIKEKFTLSGPETDTDSSLAEASKGNEIRKEMRDIKKQLIPKIISCNKLSNNEINEDSISELDFSENCNDESIYLKCKKEIKMEKDSFTNLLIRNSIIKKNVQTKPVAILQILQVKCF